ncbi:MAG: sulfotransferase [Gammaproteobacteria bacterium]|nr:sulfotransferase [Gammaproteobacteria bacterium]
MKKFMIVSAQRSGSTWVADMLGSHPEVTMFSELFLRSGEGFPDWSPEGGVAYWNTYKKERKWAEGVFLRPRLVWVYLNSVFAPRSKKSACGLKVMYDQFIRFPEILLYILVKRVSVIHLVREDVVASYISGRISHARKQPHARTDEAVKDVSVHIDVKRMKKKLARSEAMIKATRVLFKVLGIKYIEIGYEDLDHNRKNFDNLLLFVGVEIHDLKSSLRKLREAGYGKYIENRKEILEAFSNTKWNQLAKEALS